VGMTMIENLLARKAGVKQVRPGDIVTVKGSFGSRMADVVKRLRAGQPAHRPTKFPRKYPTFPR